MFRQLLKFVINSVYRSFLRWFSLAVFISRKRKRQTRKDNQLEYWFTLNCCYYAVQCTGLFFHRFQPMFDFVWLLPPIEVESSYKVRNRSRVVTAVCVLYVSVRMSVELQEMLGLQRTTALHSWWLRNWLLLQQRNLHRLVLPSSCFMSISLLLTTFVY